MKTIAVTLLGISPLSQGRPVRSTKDTGEQHDAFEERTWKERMHIDSKGRVIVPPQAVKSALQEVAKYLGETIPGKGKSTYTKHYKAGILITEPYMTNCSDADVQSERIFVPSDGISGSGKRVWKRFPFIAEGWQATGSILILDPLLESQLDAVRRHLEHAGKFIGLGRFRPINGGFYGRYEVTRFEVC